MRDNFFIDDDGTRIPTSQVPTAVILEVLRDGFRIVDPEGPDDLYWIRLRLEVELIIRRLNL